MSKLFIYSSVVNNYLNILSQVLNMKGRGGGGSSTMLQ